MRGLPRADVKFEGAPSRAPPRPHSLDQLTVDIASEISSRRVPGTNQGHGRPDVKVRRADLEALKVQACDRASFFSTFPRYQTFIDPNFNHPTMGRTSGVMVVPPL